MTPIEGEFNLFCKTPDLADQWRSRKLRASVRTRVRFAAVLLWQSGYPAILTSILRTDSGVHSVGRAADLRSNHLSRPLAESIRQEINKAFPGFAGGDGLQKETVPPLDHAGNAMASTAEHFHVQVAANAG